MATILALQNLYNVVSAEINSIRPDVVFNFGPKAIVRQPTTSFQIVDIVPGDESGNIGKLQMPMNVGGSPRNLYDIAEAFTVYIRAYDAAEPESYMRQYSAATLLWQDFVASCRRNFSGLVEFQTAKYNRQVGNERLFGCQVIIGCSLRSPIPDLVFGVGTPEIVSAHINETLADSDDDTGTTDSFDVPPST